MRVWWSMILSSRALRNLVRWSYFRPSEGACLVSVANAILPRKIECSHQDRSIGLQSGVIMLTCGWPRKASCHPIAVSFRDWFYGFFQFFQRCVQDERLVLFRIHVGVPSRVYALGLKMSPGCWKGFPTVLRRVRVHCNHFCRRFVDEFGAQGWGEHGFNVQRDGVARRFVPVYSWSVKLIRPSLKVLITCSAIPT